MARVTSSPALFQDLTSISSASLSTSKRALQASLTSKRARSFPSTTIRSTPPCADLRRAALLSSCRLIAVNSSSLRVGERRLPFAALPFASFCVMETRNAQALLGRLETEIRNQSVEAIGMKHRVDAIYLGLILSSLITARERGKTFPDRIDSCRHQTGCVPWSKEAQTISNKFGETAGIINGFESLFSAGTMTNFEQVPEPLFQFVHESSFS